MPLYNILAGQSAKARDIQQLIDLLTGVMTDETITLAGGLIVLPNALNNVPTMAGTVAAGVRIFVQPTTPTSPAPADGDVWFQV